MPLHVIVIGAGIVGVCIAHHLAVAGAAVTVLDRGEPGAGCTQGAFAMLLATHADGDAHLNALYGLAVAEWRHMTALSKELPVTWGGLLHWATPGPAAEQLKATRAKLQDWGAAAEEMTADAMQQRVPGIVPGAVGEASFLPDYGAVDIGAAMKVLVQAARDRGVAFATGEALRIDTTGDGPAVVTRDGRLEADRVVLAAGAATPALAQSVSDMHIPIHLVSGTLAYSRPMPPVLPCILNGPLGSIRQNPDGRVVTGLDYAPGADGEDVSAIYGASLLKRAAAVVPALADMQLERMVIGHVPIPADSRPVVGFCDKGKVYVAIMMSGVTLAPLLGRLAAAEVLGGRLAVLQPYRPGRWTKGEKENK